jgi:hypothetical protein
MKMNRYILFRHLIVSFLYRMLVVSRSLSLSLSGSSFRYNYECNHYCEYMPSNFIRTSVDSFLDVKHTSTDQYSNTIRYDR